MRFIFLLCFLILTYVSPGRLASAQTPPDVLTAYKAYNKALTSKDYNSALTHAKIAWQKSETALGDNVLTGDLAYNYGYLSGRLSKHQESIAPFMRSADLAHLSQQDAGLIRLEREVEFANALMNTRNVTKAAKRLQKARAFARSKNLGDTVFAGELMVLQSRLAADSANRQNKISRTIAGSRVSRRSSIRSAQSRSALLARGALEIFAENPQISRAKYTATALKLIGFSHEREKEWKEALLAYQKAMQIQKTYSTINDRNYITTVGRWINVRTFFIHDVGLEEAKTQGLCECWPYQQESANKAISITRNPPNMPLDAQTSGFSIVRFDLDDAGYVINPKILQSWPKNIYDKSSLNSLKKWKYETKENGKEGAQRANIVTTIKYILSDYMSNDPI